jgi:thiamine biosynthesis lipoprotein
MQETQIIMGMPVTIKSLDELPAPLVKEAFDYFRAVDERYSPFKSTSDVSRLNASPDAKPSPELQEILRLCELTRKQTHGYFDIRHNGAIDPSGLVKGWAIHNVATLLKGHGARNFWVEAGGDIEVDGHGPQQSAEWRIGIRNPFNRDEIVKVVGVRDRGIATSGTAIRGQHIYDPLADTPLTDIVSLTVTGPTIYDADRFATAAFAMGQKGISFIEQLDGFEGYMIDKNGTATMTSGFEEYVR